MQDFKRGVNILNSKLNSKNYQIDKVKFFLMNSVKD